MKVYDCFSFYLIFAWVLLLVVGNSSQVFSQQNTLQTRAILGYDMAAYTAPDRSFALLIPQGWTPQPSQNGITFIEKASDPISTRIDLFVIQLGQSPVTSAQFILYLANQMKARYPTFQVTGTRALSEKPDVTVVIFTYEESGIKVSGFGVAQCNPGVALWTDIYGRDDGFRHYNPALLLTYVLQSMNQGPTPGSPALPQPATIEQARQKADAQQMKKSMVMTHYWNMYPYLYPGGVFRSGY